MTTVQKSIKRLKELEAMAAEGNWEGRAKKEVVAPGAGAQAPEPESGRHQGHERLAGRAVRDRFE